MNAGTVRFGSRGGPGGMAAPVLHPQPDGRLAVEDPLRVGNRRKHLNPGFKSEKQHGGTLPASDGRPEFGDGYTRSPS